MKTIAVLMILCGSYIARAQSVIVVQDPWAIEQLMVQLARQGDPAAIQQLAGMEQLRQSLSNTGLGTTLEQIQQAASGCNAFYYDGNGLYRAIQDVIVTPDGQTAPRVEQEYRPQAALTAASEDFRAVDADAKDRRAQSRGQIRATLTRIQTATTQAEVEKLNALLAGQSAELAAIDRERDAAATRVLVQDAENRNDQARQKQARAEDRAASFRKANKNLATFLKPDTAPVSIPRSREPRP